MRTTILLTILVLASCNQRLEIVSTDVDASTPVESPDAAVAAPDRPLAATTTIESQPLKPLSAQEATALADANDDIAGLVIDQRKAYRKWLRTGKIGAELTSAREARDAMIAAVGKARARKLECLVGLFGKPLDDAEPRARACGVEQWVIAANGGVVGGK